MTFDVDYLTLQLRGEDERIMAEGKFTGVRRYSE